MTHSRLPDTNRLDLESVDEWAIGLVVNEGVRMNLSYTEKLVAVTQMHSKRMSTDEMASRLRVSSIDVEAMVRRVARLRLARHAVARPRVSQ